MFSDPYCLDMFSQVSFLEPNLRYQDAFAGFLSGYNFDLFVTISLGVSYKPEELEKKLRRLLKHVTFSPYQCGFVGVYSDYRSPHVHLLLTCYDELLDPELIRSTLRMGFRRKDRGEGEKRTDYSCRNEADRRKNVERACSCSVVVQQIKDLRAVVRYLCHQYPNMPEYTCNEIIGNQKALAKSKKGRRTEWESKGMFLDLKHLEVIRAYKEQEQAQLEAPSNLESLQLSPSQPQPEN